MVKWSQGAHASIAQMQQAFDMMGYDLDDVEFEDDFGGVPPSAGSANWGGLETVDEDGGTDTDGRPQTAESFLDEAAEEQFESLYQDLAEAHPEVQEAHAAEVQADLAAEAQLRSEIEKTSTRVQSLDERVALLLAAFKEAEAAGAPTDKIADELSMARKELEVLVTLTLDPRDLIPAVWVEVEQELKKQKERNLVSAKKKKRQHRKKMAEEILESDNKALHRTAEEKVAVYHRVVELREKLDKAVANGDDMAVDALKEELAAASKEHERLMAEEAALQEKVKKAEQATTVAQPKRKPKQSRGSRRSLRNSTPLNPSQVCL